MKILVVEDEKLVAKRIIALCEEVLKNQFHHIELCTTIDEAFAYLENESIDLLMLDLNLNGKSGFTLLKNFAAKAFHTIIVSAYAEKAVEAFEYGVLDFIPKPLTSERLEKAFDRFQNSERQADQSSKYLYVKKGSELMLFNVEDVSYIQRSGSYSEIHLKNGRTTLHDKALNSLLCILPSHFIRIHKSYIANMNEVDRFRSHGASRYDLVLKNDDILPVSRAKYKEIKQVQPSL